jgi:hypothetical protein
MAREYLGTERCRMVDQVVRAVLPPNWWGWEQAEGPPWGQTQLWLRAALKRAGVVDLIRFHFRAIDNGRRLGRAIAEESYREFYGESPGL